MAGNAGPVRGSEKGAEMLEFALVFSVLMSLVLGIVVFARAYNVYQSINRAAREGARMATLPSSIYDKNQFIDPAVSTTQAGSTIFNDYIKPALLAASLNPNPCASSADTNCIANYTEQVNWLDPNSPKDTTDNQCGVFISFQYPYPLSVPFLGAGLGRVNLPASVQMRLENQPASGVTTCR